MEMTPQEAVVAEAEEIILRRQSRDLKIGLAMWGALFLAKHVLIRVLTREYYRSYYR